MTITPNRDSHFFTAGFNCHLHRKDANAVWKDTVATAPAAPQQGFITGKPSEDVEVAWLLVRSLAGDGEGGSDESDTVVLALRGDDADWLVAGDWRANSTLDSVHDDGGWIVGWMPYEVPAARLAAAAQAPAAPTPVAWPVARDVLQRWAQFADQAMRIQPRDMRNNMETLAEELTKLSAMAPMAAPAAPSALAAQVIENLLQLARIVNTAVEDWGETKEDHSMEVIFHKEEADKLEETLDFFDSLPDAPAEEGVILSGPSRAARMLRSQAAPAAPSGVVGDMAALVKQLVQALRKASPGNDLAGKALDYLKRHGLQGSPLRVHSDDAAVDRFSAAMKAKLAAARAKGRGGWKDCHPQRLSRMLREHVEKGDPRDVANFCMFLWCLGQPITAAPTAHAVDAETAKKAARYDYLRSRDLSTIEFGGLFAGRTPDNVVLNGEDLDAAIDESIATADQPAK